MKYVLIFIAVFSLQTLAVSAEPSLKDKVKTSIDKGIRFLRNAENQEGNWGDPGITALAVTAMMKSYRQYTPADGPWIRRPLDYLVSLQKEDGGIYTDQLANYYTAVAIMALAASGEKKYQPVIEKAQQFIIKLQCDEGEGYNPQTDKFYGGFGYGSSERPDLSNTQFALEALRESGVDPNNPVFKKAVVFLQRCQNRSESNDQEWAGNDGGFVYYSGNSAAGKETRPDGKTGYRSYGSMTYAGIKSYIYADLKIDDPRVQAAYDWIKKNYSIEDNPGMGKQGMFYYYHTFAKTLILMGIDKIDTPQGEKHDWKEELAQKLISLQSKDGSWVNPNDRWWESNPVLVTAYAVIALSHCYSKL